MKYEKPNMDIQIFDVVDIVCTSPESGLDVDDNYGGEDFSD